MMKYLYTIIIVLITVITISAQGLKSSSDIPSSFEEKMINTAKEVSQTFGPAYNVDKATRIEISGPFIFEDNDKRPEIQACIGRKYYTITFIPENTEEYEFPFLSEVSIWADGEPQGVTFGNGWGRNFFFRSYSSQKKDELIKTIPLQKCQ